MFSKILKTIKTEKTKSNISYKPDPEEIPSIENPQQKEIQFQKCMLDLMTCKVGIYSDSFYKASIISSEEEQYIIDQIYLHSDRWVSLAHAKRRVQKYGGEVTPQGLKDVEELPQFLQQLGESKLAYFFDQKINHALINEYQRGVGIMNHFDGPLYYPFVNIISLESYCIFKFTREQDQKQLKLLVEPRSLLVFTNDLYDKWHHGIDYVDEDIILIQLVEGKVLKSDVDNYELTDLAQYLSQITIDEQFNYNGHRIDVDRLHGNPDFNYALSIQRQKRVSVTLRYVQ